MLDKFLKVPKLGHFPGRDTADRMKQPAVEHHKPEERSPSVVRIVHAGAKVEVYFMAIPAGRIMEKYPSHCITTPEVFRRPWDAVVKPDEILALGKKYYVVPRQTVKKLRRRILKPSVVSPGDSNHTRNEVSLDSGSETYTKLSVDSTDASDTSGGFRTTGRRKVGTKKRVRFRGIDESLRRRSLPEMKKTREDEEDESAKVQKPQTHGKRKAKLHSLTWQPSLAAITEAHE
ncbi:hypothetical protein MLD38_020249 [Melastoma candidum]|uniref:Uncharacterized protein n=1 Tax=Melastoma candidum TaxID=119954 RepID=A0ACB9QFC6_9MYRT|nr:hypothetical protein MLD38_020249 [Melastoma candidum]